MDKQRLNVSQKPLCLRLTSSYNHCCKTSCGEWGNRNNHFCIPSIGIRVQYGWGVSTACGHRRTHRIWKETKQQPGTSGPGNMLGCCLFSFHILWAILCPQAVQYLPCKYYKQCGRAGGLYPIYTTEMLPETNL